MEAVKYINKLDYLEFIITNLKLINPKVNNFSKTRNNCAICRAEFKKLLEWLNVPPFSLSIPKPSIVYNILKSLSYQLRFRQEVKSSLFD